MNTTNVLPRTLVTRVVGVSYEGRQTIVSQLKMGETVFLVRDPDNAYDRNAIRVILGDERQVGFVNRNLAARLAPIIDQCEGVLRAQVAALTGGYDPFSFRGALIRFDLPE
jgi:single-stranded-DNA-specific exonuclease